MSDQFVSMIFHQAWQIAALTIIVALIVRIAARNRPYLAHALWVLVLIKCVTPPLWGHSLGVFSQLLAWTTPAEVPADEVMPAVDTPADLPPVEAIKHVDLVVPEDVIQVLVTHDVWPGDAEVSFDEEAQRQRNAEEQADLASLGLNDSALEIPPLESGAEIHATEQPSSPAVDQLPSLLFGGFLIGSIITLMTMVIRCLRCLRQIHLHQTTEFDDVIRERIQQLAKQLGIRRIPNIIVSDVLFGPAVLGLLRHTIVLPRCLFDDVGDGWRAERPKSPDDVTLPVMQRQQSEDLRPAARLNVLENGPADFNLQFLDPILAHELLHIRRGDLRTGTLQAIAQSLWWFHPAVWFCNRWLSREAERCCDEQVIAELGCTPAHYARSLLSVIECKHRLQPIPVFPGMKPVEITSQRMERIMSLKNGLKKRTPIWCWLMIVALAFIVLPGAVAKTTPDEVKPESPSERPATDTSVAVAEEEKSHPTVQAKIETAPQLELQKDKQEIPAAVPDWIRNSSDHLVKLVWDARAASQRRLMMTDQRIPWLFMEGLAALRREFLIRDGNEAIVGLDWLQNARESQSYRYPYHGPWFQKTEHGAQPNPRSVEFGYDDHAQEFVATLAMNDVPLDAKFKAGDDTITMGDLVKHLQMTVSEKKLAPWTLMALSKYLPRNEKWTNAKGEDWSIERLVAIELEQSKEVGWPMSLMSLAAARNHYFAAGESLEGNWLKADQRIRSAIDASRPSTTSDGRFVTTYHPSVRFQQPQYRSPFGPRIYAVGSTPTHADRLQLDMEANRRRPLAAFTDNIALTYRAQMLLFLTIALPDNELGKDWIRREIEIAANDLVADWSNPEIRSPFYETTHALTVYQERYPKYLEYVAEAGLSPILAGNDHVQVRVKGMVRQPSSYKYVGTNGLRLLEVITRAGGPSDESADTVSVIRKVETQPLPTVLQVNLQRLKSGADPNFSVMPGDEVLVQTADFVKTPLAASIRLDDKFILSPETSFKGETVVAFVNDKPITVEKMMGSVWDKLQKPKEASDSVKNQITCEWIASSLPTFVYQELVLQYFQADLQPTEEISPQHRELTYKMFVDALEKAKKLGTTDDDRRKFTKNLGAVLAKDFSSEEMQKKNQVVAYVKGFPNNSVAKTNASVTKHVQELVTTARLRALTSLHFNDINLTELMRSIAIDHGFNVALKTDVVATASRIANKPATINYHCKHKPLGESIKAMVEPLGLCIRLDGETLSIEYADYEKSMARFRALPGPPSFAVYGIVKNTGWQKLGKEIRLLDAIEMAGGVEDSEGVSIAITNLDIIDGKAIPVSMSLRVLQNDTSGKLNRVVKDGDMITVTRNDSTEAAQAGSTDGVKVQGNGVNSDSGLVGTFQYDDPREGPAVAAPLEIAENKPASNENSPEARFVLVSYPVADLVVFRQPAKANTDRFVAVDSPAPQPPGTAASPAVVPEDSADQVEKNPLSPLPQPKDNSRNFKADFAPLTELIKASVQPESWDPVGPTIIGVDEKTLSLVIRHTQTAHDEICKLIIQLRKADDQMISITSQIVKLTDDAQVQWLGTQCSLHSLENGTQWALLPQLRSEALTRELLGRKPDVLSAPKVMTISGQTATIQVGQTNTEDDTTIGVRLEMTPHLLPDTKVFRLQHAVQIGKLSADEMPPVESLVGSGQTLLLLLDAASESKEQEVPTSKYLLLITPEYVPMVEEAENVAAPQANNKAEANP